MGQPQQPKVHVIGDPKAKEGKEKTIKDIMAGNFSKFDENHKHTHARNSKNLKHKKGILTNYTTQTNLEWTDCTTINVVKIRRQYLKSYSKLLRVFIQEVM